MGKNEYIKSVEQKEVHQKPPKVSILDCLNIADMIKAETGRYPTYGEVSESIESGRINPADYLRGKRR